MREWLTARELVSEELPHIPTTVKGVLDLADREGWTADDMRCRRRAGRGGGKEFHFSLLPLVAQVAFKAKYLRIGSPAMPAAANDEPESQNSGRALTGRAALERDARLAIVRAFDHFAKGQSLNKGATEALFVMKYEGGSIRVDDWVRDLVPRVSRRSLARWRDEAKLDRERLGFDRSVARKGTGFIDTAEDGKLKLFVLGLITHQPFLSAEHVKTQCRSEFGDTITVVADGQATEVEMPSVRQFQRALKALKAENHAVITKLTNPDLFRSTMKTAGVGVSREVRLPNQFWQIDASPVDALCTDGRKNVYACIDVAPRRAIFYVSDTPRASAVALLLRKAILAWGVPERVKTDNGSDFKAKETSRLFASLGIEPEVSDAYSPEQKGFVERVIGTFQRDFTPLVPGFIGHSVADRKAIESQKSFAQRLGEDDATTFRVAFDGATLQTFIDAWVEVDYSHRPHRSLQNRSPFQVAAESAHTVRKVDERALDILMMPVAGKDGIRIQQKRGLEIDGHFYLNASIMPGRPIFVRRDPSDLGRVHAFCGDDGRYLGEALCAELAGIDGKTFTAAQKELQGEAMAVLEKQIRAERKRISKDKRSLIERALEVKRRDVPNVVALPRPTVEHSTPSIAAALDAAESKLAKHKPRAVVPLTGRAAEIQAELMREAAGAAPVVPIATVTKLNTRETRWRRATSIEAAIAAGEEVPVEDALWLGGYREDGEYRAMKAMAADFGQSIGG